MRFVTGGHPTPKVRSRKATVGVNWVRRIDRTYDVARMRDTLREALTPDEKGAKVIVASSECMLNKQRRERPLLARAIHDGKRPGCRGRRRTR